MRTIRPRSLLVLSGAIATAISSPARAQIALSVDVPVSLAARDVQAFLEGAIPRDDVRLGAWTYDGGQGYRFGAWRGPISVQTTPAGLRITSTLEYEAHACVRAPRPRPLRGYICPEVASCGSGEPHPSVQLVIDVGGTWSPDWSFDLKTSVSATVLHPCCCVARPAAGLVADRLAVSGLA